MKIPRGSSWRTNKVPNVAPHLGTTLTTAEMSGTEAQECSRLKVHYDFEYNANDGRQIAIKKDEKLYLVQKTNSDWWKVVRNWDQQSFYVPATYVTEVGATSLSQENFHNKQYDKSRERPVRDQTPKDRAAKRKVIEKWLSSTADMLQSKEPLENIENLKEYDSVENLSDPQAKEPGDQLSRALIERNFDTDDFDSSRCHPARRNSEIFRKNAGIDNNPVAVPTNTSIKTVPVTYDSSLQMAANNPIAKLPVLENYICERDNHDIISHSNGSPVRSSYDKLNLSPEHRTESMLRSTSFDFNPTVRSAKTNVDRVNAASSSSKDASTILNDKRKSWAVEELMSELMQLRKERVDNNKTNFVLRSVQIKDRFDPLEKLTEELHELHASQAPESAVKLAPRVSKTEDTSAVGKCVDSDVSHVANDVPSSNVPKSRPPDALTSAEIKVRPIEVLPVATKTTLQMSPKISPLKSNTNVPATPANCKLYKCTSKKLDEYEEANILHSDVGMAAGAGISRIYSDNYKAPLSPDNESSHRSAYHVHSQLFRSDNCKLDNFEKPSYSNISISVDGKPKLRPKLKLTIDSIDTKIRLTPSLEKLASEIEFLPANRTSIPDNDKWESFSGKSGSVKVDTNDRNWKVKDNQNVQKKLGSADDALNICQEQEMWKNFKSKLTYKSSFESKEEKPRQHDPGTGPTFSINDIRAKKSNLKKSATFHGGALPGQRKYSFGFNSSESNARRAAVIKAKRRSRSLDNINRLLQSEAGSNQPKSLITSSNISVDSVQAKPEITGGSMKLRSSPDKNQQKIDAKSEITKLALIPNDLRNQSSRAEKEEHAWSETSSLPSKSYRNINEDIDNLILYDKNKSTAVSFKNLLCTSDSGSDEYLQYKPFPKSVISKNEREICIPDGKPNPRANQSTESLNNPDGSVSERQISSANISSEALFSQSESEVYAVSDLSDNPSPVIVDDGKESFVRLPPGWRQEYDPDLKQICFINSRQEKWFSSNDADGKIYFFEENSNESSWILPSISIDDPNPTDMQNRLENVELRTIRSSSNNDKPRFGKAHSMVVVNQSANKKDHMARRSGSVSQDWPQLRDGNMHILKEGILQKTKITENGKRTRKNWSSSYVVLSELLLLFFKDAKTFTAAMSREPSSAKPEISVDLNGATIEPGGKASSRKNVFIISTALGLQLLIQSDNITVATEWYQKICGVIGNLPSGPDIDTESASSLERPSIVISGTSLPEESKLISRIGRSRSMKLKRTDGSMEDLSASSTDRQTNLLKARLKRFFQRRPNMEMLIKNGIYKDEPVFGAYLANVCSRQPPMVPPFVKECIRVLEENPENMKTDGLYRASGNLSQIQKIRLQVDQNNLDVLKQEEDVHVLAGALKLFFRELKEPLLPYTCFTKALLASVMKKKSEKLRNFREIVQALSPSHHDTLKYLLQHLLRVVSYREYNRMDIQNLAIVFGPTLMWPAFESTSIEVDFMQQNFVIECLLTEYDEIFEKRKNEGMLRT